MFKKTLIAASLATMAMAAPLAASADATVYGSIRLSMVGVDDGDDMKWNVKNNSSRLGFKGSEELDNGLKAVAHYEMGVGADTGTFGGGTANRLSYVGIEGGFGGIYIGAQWTPFYTLVGGTTDQFNALGANHINSTFRIGDAIAYAGTFGPATVIAAIIASDFSTEDYDDDDAIDIIHAGAKFDAGPVTVGVALDNRSEGTGDGTRYGLAATYSAGEMTVAAEFTSTEAEMAGTEDDATGIEVYAGFGLGNGNLIHASYGQTDNGDATPSDITLGYQKKMSKRTKMWVEAGLGSTDVDGDDDTTTIAVGMRHDW